MYQITGRKVFQSLLKCILEKILDSQQNKMKSLGKISITVRWQQWKQENNYTCCFAEKKAKQYNSLKSVRDSNRDVSTGQQLYA